MAKPTNKARPLKLFITEYCDLSPDARMPAHDLYEAYVRWYQATIQASDPKRRAGSFLPEDKFAKKFCRGYSDVVDVVDIDGDYWLNGIELKQSQSICRAGAGEKAGNGDLA